MFERVREFIKSCSEIELAFLRGFLEASKENVETNEKDTKSEACERKVLETLEISEKDLQILLFRSIEEIKTSTIPIEYVVAAIFYYFAPSSRIDTTISNYYKKDYMQLTERMSIRMMAMVNSRDVKIRDELIENFLGHYQRPKNFRPYDYDFKNYFALFDLNSGA